MVHLVVSHNFATESRMHVEHSGKTCCDNLMRFNEVLFKSTVSFINIFTSDFFQLTQKNRIRAHKVIMVCKTHAF